MFFGGGGRRGARCESDSLGDAASAGGHHLSKLAGCKHVARSLALSEPLLAVSGKDTVPKEIPHDAPNKLSFREVFKALQTDAVRAMPIGNTRGRKTRCTRPP